MFNLDDYEPVEKRLGYKKDAKSFWEDNPDGRVFTQLLDFSTTRYIVQAFVYKSKDDQHPWATGLAEETIQGRGVNATSALENAETSALGRALAAAGYATKGKRPSREEMTKVKAKNDNSELIAETKARLAETAKEYVPVAKEDDPWTIREAAPASTVDEAVKMVKDIIGGQTERDIPNCKCGKPMSWRTGQGKNNKPWGHFACTNVPARKCMEPIWYEVSASGAWAPQKVKW
jgi:hypothetical protein